MKPADWLAARFGLPTPAELVGPVDRGYQGQVWRLTCGSQAYAVKEALHPLDPAQVAAAYALQTRASKEGVAAPRQLLTVDGEPAVTADGETLRVFAWVELAAPDRGLDPGAVGALLAALHRAGGRATRPVDDWYIEPVGTDRWHELLDQLRRAGAPFAADLEQLLPDLAASEAVLEPPGDVLVCHRDLWADNVRRGGDGRPVVIDWDNCGPASAAGELAMVLAEFGTDDVRARDLYDGYRAAGGPARLTDPGDFTMPLAVLHHLVELATRQWLAATDEPGREQAAGRVAEFTDDPFGLPQVRQLLAALS